MWWSVRSETEIARWQQVMWAGSVTIVATYVCREFMSRSGRRVTKTIEKCQVTRHDTERYTGELREQEKQQQC